MASKYGQAPATDTGSVAGEAAETTDETEDGSDWQELHRQAMKTFKLASEVESENRANYIEDIKFGRIGGKEQWPAQVHANRTDKGLPCLTINMMPSFIHQVVNDTRQNKPGITVRPVDSGADPETADVIGGMIRHIEAVSGADAAYDTAVDTSASGGFGYIRVAIDWTHDDSFDKEIYIRRVPDPLVIYGDPRSLSVDSLDWNDAFVLDWMPEEEFKERWPNATVADFRGDGATVWRRDGEVLVCEWWHRTEIKREIVLLSNGWVIGAEEYDAPEQRAVFDAMGLTKKNRRPAKSYKVCQYHMSGEEILEEEEYPGRYIPIAPVYGEEVVLEGKRTLRSLIRDGKDPQRNFNYGRSKGAEAAALAVRETWVGKESAFTGEYANRWETANSQNHPFLAVPDNVELPQRSSPNGIDPAAMQQAAAASDDMNRTIGIYKAGLGAPSNETSGRAINARKIEGDTGTFHFTDNLSRAIRCTGIIVVDLLPHVYTPGRIARTLGPDGKEKFVQIGTKTPGPDQIPEQRQDSTGVESAAIYDIGLGKYDVVVQPGPGYTTRREQAADQMMELVRSFPQLGPLVGDLIAENLDWPGAEEFAKRIRAMLPPQIKALLEGGNTQIPPELMQQVEQGKQLISKLMEALQKSQAELQTAKAGNDIEAMKLEVERMSVAVDMFNAQTQRIEAEIKRGQMQMQSFQTAVATPGIPHIPHHNPIPLG